MRKIGNILLCLLLASSLLTPTNARADQIQTRLDIEKNLAVHKPAFESGNQGGKPPANAVDANGGTRWASHDNQNAWWYVDLGEPTEIAKVVINFESLPNKYIIQVANSAEGPWKDVYTGTHEGAKFGDAGIDTINLDQAEIARYVKFQGVKTTYDDDGVTPWRWGYTFWEFEVYSAPLSDETYIDSYLQGLKVPAKVAADFTLPIHDDEFGVDIAWTSDHGAMEVDAKGNVKVIKKETSQDVNLTAKVTRGDAVKTKVFPVRVVSSIGVQANIYPTPQNLSYGKQTLPLSEVVNGLMSDSLTTYTKQYAEKVLGDAGITLEKGTAKVSDKVNLIIGVVGDNSEADQFFENQYDAKNSTDLDDGYVLKIDSVSNTIAVLGKDSNAAFNGLSTLAQILRSKEKNLQDVLVEDYADTKFRGVIEGFYGAYTHQERLDLLKFMGPLKMGSYLYGAKSDEYHKNRWREYYPADKLSELSELVETGKQNNVELLWAAHVGGNINMGSDADYDALIKKFDQLYSIGVRQFGIFYDDAGTDNTHFVEFVNKVNREYIHKKEGVKDLVICPQVYAKTHGGVNYLKMMSNFDQDVQIMWTGDSVISEVSNSMMDYIEPLIKRPAFIWWNYPVNDLGMRDQLLVGETVGLHNDIKSLRGLVSNPMLEEQSSKFSLFSIADYGWNHLGFNSQKSWEAGVEQIIPEKEYADAFKKFASNNNQSLFELKDIAVESDYLIEAIEQFQSDYAAGKSIDESGQYLRDEYQAIHDASEKLKGYAANPNLVREITPWLNNMIQVTNAGMEIFDVALALKSTDFNITELQNIHKTLLAANDEIEHNGGKLAGTRRLKPLIKDLVKKVNQDMARILNKEELFVPISNTGSELKEVIDGNKATFTTFDKVQKDGDWFGIDLGKNTAIHSVEIILGKNDQDTNVSVQDLVQVSDDFNAWRDVSVQRVGNTITLDEPISGRYIRYYAVEGCKKQMSVREFRVNAQDYSIYTNTNLTDIALSENNNEWSMNELGEITLAPQQYIGMQFRQMKVLSSIAANAELYKLSVQYSEDGKQWTTIEGNLSSIVYAKYVRVINSSTTAQQVSFGKLSITIPMPLDSSKLTVTKSDDLAIWEGDAGRLIDGDRNSYIWTKDQVSGQNYVLDLKEITDIYDVSIYMLSGDIMKSGVVEVSTDKVEWKVIGNIQEQPINTIKTTKTPARYVRVKVTSNSGTWLKMNEIEINKSLGNSKAPVMSMDEGTLIVDQDTLTKMKVPATAGSITYKNVNIPHANTLKLLKNKDTAIKVEGLFDDGWKTLVETNEAFIDFAFGNLGLAKEIKLSWNANSNVELYEMAVDFDATLVSKANLNKAIKKAQQMVKDGALQDIDASIVERFEQALAKALELSENVNANQSAVDEATAALELAIKNVKEDTTFVKSILKSAIDKANVLESTGKLDKLAPIVKAMIIAARDDAQEVYHDVAATMEQCLAAWLTLANALQYQDFEADKALLLSLINTCKEINTDDYIDGVEEFKVALAAAQVVYDNPNALQASIDKAYDDLEAAKTKLVKNDSVDKLLLENLIANIEEKMGDGSKYQKNAAYEAFEKALQEAKDVVENKKATQADVNTAFNNLAEAYMNIRLIPSEEQLAQLRGFLDVVKRLNRGLFSKEQLQQIDAVTEEVTAIIVNFDDQKFVGAEKNMVAVLAMIHTVEKANAELSGNEELNKADGSAHAANPNTGDATNAAAILVLFILSGCGIFYSQRKRKQSNK